ncbi:MAG: hemerythrin domain-containing protein [Dehalococcoidia bacterium]
MTLLTQPLRDEHQDLFPHVQSLRRAAEAVGSAPAATLRGAVDEAYAFLTEHLIPHAQAEDRALYPAEQRVLGAPEATATMSRDHVEVGRLTAELAALRPAVMTDQLTESDGHALRRVLYGLYALITVHFAKEEEVYLPLLDARLKPDEATRMFTAMEEAAHAAKATHGLAT